MASGLTAEQVAEFGRDGFLVIDRLIDPSEVDRIRRAYGEILDGALAIPGDRLLGGLTRQVMQPHLDHPTFADNAALRAAIEIGGALVGEPVSLLFDMLIDKPPGHPHETPWHQDMAYAGVPTARAGSPIPLRTLQFWVALDDVDVDNGCMQFIPGRHRDPLMAHVVAGGAPDDDGRLLAIADPERDVDTGSAVAVPLPPGGCTVHAYGTPHRTGPNCTTDRPRRAYIFNLAA